jgi:hypothetical protein
MNAKRLETQVHASAVKGCFRCTSDLSYHKLPVLCLFVVSTGGARVDFSFRRTLNVVSERMP